MKTFIERLSLENYKSIAHCDVELRPLTVVIGRNGSGKSNLVDSLHFIADALTTSLEYAVRKREGWRGITRRGARTLSIELWFRLDAERFGAYALTLLQGRVRTETLTLQTSIQSHAGFERKGQEVEAKMFGLPFASPTVLPDRLALVALSGQEQFREVFDALASIRFYRLDPEAMRTPQDFDEGHVLREDGSNIPSVWARLQRASSSALRRLMTYLDVIAPGVKRVHRVRLGKKETLHFHQRVSGSKELMFQASSMSDGTLRALGTLVATRQRDGAANTVIIEEPETALHPGAVAALMDALHEASSRTQVIVTSHSPDVLDHLDLGSDALLVTEARVGVTVVGGVDAASREAIRRHLYTPGELLRMDQLQLENAASE